MRKRLRLLMTISDLRGGGAEREFASLVKALSLETFDIELLFWRRRFDYPVPEGFPVHIVKKERPWDVLRTIAGVRSIVEERRPDVVFSQLHYVNIVTGTALARSSHRPKWVCRQVNDPKREMRGPMAWWAKWALREADVVLGASDGVTGAMVDYLGIPRHRTRTMVNAVDVARISSLAGQEHVERPASTFVVAHAGRLTRQKNQSMLLRAFAGLKGESELWILGQGEREADLRMEADRLGISDKVRFMGFVDNPYPYFAAADVFALTSNHEGLPNVIIESMLCRTPVVSTACDYGPEELIDDGRTGFLVRVGDQTEMTSALQRLLEDRDLARQMGSQARSWAESEFDTSKVVRRYEDLFVSVAADAQ